MSRVIHETKELTFIPNELDSANSSYGSINSSYPITNAYTNSSSTSYAEISCRTGFLAATHVSLKFPIENIPTQATIDSIVCKAKVSVSSTARLYTAHVQLYKGTTAMGSSVSARDTAATVYTISNPGTWTIDDLKDLEIRYTARRGIRETSDVANLYFYGADVTITYTFDGVVYEITSVLNADSVSEIIPSGVTEVNSNENYELKIYANSIDDFKAEDNGVDVTSLLELVNLSEGQNYYWKYTLTSVSDDHTIIISTTIIEIPEENPDYNYYSITISSINATTTPGKGTTRVVEGTNEVVTIVPAESKITRVTDNGVDITDKLVLHSNGDPSYTVTTPAGANYDFSLNESTGYYESTNNGKSKSASVARVNFNLPVKCLITIEYINYAEAGYDYGMFGNIDTAVATDGLTDSSGSSSPSDSLDNYYYICNSSSDNTNTPKTLTYEIEAGEHFIDIKYGKDNGTNSGNDNLQWKILSIEQLEANNYYTYTLTNITESHSLIFIFGDVTYYLINSSGSNSKLFPAGALVCLPGDSYLLRIVPDSYLYNVSVKDNNIDVTGYVERKEQIVQKEGQDITVVNYIYKINDVQETHNIVVNCIPSSIYIKIQSTWVKVNRVYKKEGDKWNEVTDFFDLTNLFDTSKVYNTIFL